MVKGNCLIIIGDEAEAVNSGETVFIQPFADLL
jgi:molybdopterin molybdotransferase